MWRSYLAAALRNLSRNRLHSVITTLSLAIGFTAVILASLFWRYEHSYDRFWPNADRLTLVGEWLYSQKGFITKGGITTASDGADPLLATRLADLPQVEAVARMAQRPMLLEHGRVSGVEFDLQWADPELFSVLAPKPIAGDLRSALSRPNSIVLTQDLARKYFGDENPVGQVMTLSPDPGSGSRRAGAADPLAVQVTAVIGNIPGNSHLAAGAFVSGMTSGSPIVSAAGKTALFDRLYEGVHTYLLMSSAADRPALQARLDDIARQEYAPGPGQADRTEFRALPITQVYAKPPGYYDTPSDVGRMGTMKEADPGQVVTAGIAAALMMVVASINFIILMTARGAGRAVEIGIRKIAGARRRDLVAQLVGECLIYAGLAFILGLAGAELATPAVNAFTGLDLGFDYRRDAGLIGLLLAASLAMGAIAGAYPALVLSAFRPSLALKGGVRLPGSSRLRQGLIAIQFIPLIVLGLGTLSTYQYARGVQQAQLSMLDPDALLIQETCTPSLKSQIAALPGVVQIACLPAIAWGSYGKAAALNVGDFSPDGVGRLGGPLLNGFRAAVDYGALEFHGMKPLAGLTFAADRPGGDAGLVINEAGRAALGFTSAAAAVGATVNHHIWSDATSTMIPRPITIIGVVNDRGQGGAPPEFYFYKPSPTRPVIGVKLAPDGRAETLAVIDRLWAAAGKTTTMKRSRYADLVAGRLGDQGRVTGALGIALGVGLFVAAIGLFGLSVFLAEQRTKEIGVRKALGAGRAVVLRRLLFQFAWPVILANLIACPLFLVVSSLMTRGVKVADRPAIGPDIYLSVIAGSMLVAFVAVFANAWRVSGQRPVKALRYE